MSGDILAVREAGWASELLRLAQADPDGAWQRLTVDEVPIVEQISGLPDRLLVTFLFRPSEAAGLDDSIGEHAIAAVSVVSGAFPGQGPRALTRVPQTDLWMTSVEVTRGTKGSYWFSVELDSPGGAAVEVPDVLNPDTFHIHWIERGRVHLSVLDTSARTNPDPAWWDATSTSINGQLDEIHHHSELMGFDRRLWVYAPGAVRGRKSELLVVFDGDAYLEGVSVPAMLENLIAADLIPPTTAVLVESPRLVRIPDLWTNPTFAAMIVHEVLPLVRARYNVTDSPATAAGASAGGLCAAYVTLQHPDHFSRAVSLSGAFWRPAPRPGGDFAEFEETEEWGWLAHEYAVRGRKPVRLYVAVGINETRTGRGRHQPPILWANRNLRDVLTAHGYQFSYVEYLGGHDPICWREQLAHGLVYVNS